MDMGGQKRRAWLESLEQYIPPEIRPHIEALAGLNPVNDVTNSMASAGRGDYFQSALDAAPVVAPMVAGGILGRMGANTLDDAARWAEEALTGFSATPGAVAGAGFVADEAGSVALRGADPAAQRGDEILDMLRTGRASEVTDDMLDMGDATLNARLNEYLFKNYDLPMDEASRMARAEGMGFGGDMYHGTGADVIGFDPSLTNTDHGWYGVGSYFGQSDTADAFADTYREGGNVIPAVSRGKVMQWPEGQNAAQDRAEALDLTQNVSDLGYSGIDAYAPNNLEVWGKDAGTWRERVVFDPRNIRSRFARFDPRLAHLRNLSAAGVPLALGLDYLAAQPEPEGY